jgi:hypothetical protein
MDLEPHLCCGQPVVFKTPQKTEESLYFGAALIGTVHTGANSQALFMRLSPPRLMAIAINAPQHFKVLKSSNQLSTGDWQQPSVDTHAYPTRRRRSSSDASH